MNKSVFNGLVHLLGDLFYTFVPLFIKKGAIGGTFHHLIDKYFWICYINFVSKLLKDYQGGPNEKKIFDK